jgi:hypothetical protein
MADLDPDNGFFFQTPSEYYNELTFNRVFTEQQTLRKKFSLMFINIRSVVKNLESLFNYLHSLNFEFLVIGLAETWLTPVTEHLCSVPHYSYHCQNRINRTGGGVGFLVRDSSRYIPRPDLGANNENLECYFIELPSSTMVYEKSILGVIYRPPGTMIDEFFALVTPILEKIKSEKKKCYLMGDFNLDLMNSDAHAQTAQFLDLIYSFSFYPLVDKPTRITPHSSTLIHNIFVNSFQEHISGLLYTDVSDHLPIFAVDSSSRGEATENRVTKYRRINEQFIEQFKLSVAQYDWDNLYQIVNAEDAYNHFACVLRTLYDQHFPMVDCRGKSKPDKPWITSAIKKSIRVKNKLYKLSHRFPTVYNILKHKAYKSCLNATIVLRKKMYYRSALNDYKGNLKETWKLLKEVIGVSSKKTISQSFHVDYRGDISDPGEIAGEFNDYFVKVGSKLADTIPVCNLNPLHYVRRNCNSIFFTPVVNRKSLIA